MAVDLRLYGDPVSAAERWLWRWESTGQLLGLVPGADEVVMIAGRPTLVDYDVEGPSVAVVRDRRLWESLQPRGLWAWLRGLGRAHSLNALERALGQLGAQ